MCRSVLRVVERGDGLKVTNEVDPVVVGGDERRDGLMILKERQLLPRVTRRHLRGRRGDRRRAGDGSEDGVAAASPSRCAEDQSRPWIIVS